MRCLHFTKTSIVALTIVALATASALYAGPVSVTVGSWGPTSFPGPVTPPPGAPHSLDGWGYPGDTVSLIGNSSSLNLIDGNNVLLKINTLMWGVDYTYNGTATAWDYPANWPDLTFSINALRSINIGGTSGNISQNGTLISTWFDDYLSFAAGPMVSLYVSDAGKMYRVDVTPLGLQPVSVDTFNGSIDPPEGGFPQASRDILANFKVTEVVPEPSMMLLLAIGLGAASLAGSRRKK